jgi:hypothetical protein
MHCPQNFSGRNFRFTEHAPPKAECDHPICHCTANVCVRPAGEPSSVNQYIYLTPLQLGKLRTEFDLSNGWLTFRWDITPEEIKRCIYERESDKHDPHAYFMFHPGQRSVNIEMMVPGYGLTDYFFADLYMGKKIDTSKFINGHSPSDKVNLSGSAHQLSLSPISDEDLWLYRCGWGVEAMRFLSAGEEADQWRQTILRMERLYQLMAQYSERATRNKSVDDVLYDVKSNLDVFELSHRIISHCEQVAFELQTTNLFQMQREIDRELHENND